MAQPEHRNNLFAEEDMELCTQIAYPHIESNTTEPAPFILKPKDPSRILNTELCSCEHCNCNGIVMPTYLLIILICKYYVIDICL